MTESAHSSVSLSRLQAFYNDLETENLIFAMLKEFEPGRIVAFSSFGSYSALLLSMVAAVDKKIPVLFLDTEKHFKETVEYVEKLRDVLKLENLRLLKPDTELLAKNDADGTLWQRQVNRCCWLRKVEPLERELKGNAIEAVITGRRRYQTGARAELEKIELDEQGRFRINPIGLWSKDQVKAEFARRGLPQHPLVERGYPSIGCEPCTKEVRPGEDERSGRWAHTVEMQGGQKQECGIHTSVGAPVQSWDV
jgi:phosphoadenosine phosphosulfate reductase